METDVVSGQVGLLTKPRESFSGVSQRFAPDERAAVAAAQGATSTATRIDWSTATQDPRVATQDPRVAVQSPRVTTSWESPAPGLELAEELVEELAEELAETARRALAVSPYLDIRLVEVSTRGGSVLLQGNLNSFYHKQLVLEVLRFAFGKVPVLDELSVT